MVRVIMFYVSFNTISVWGGGALKKNCAERREARTFFRVFRVKNHDFTPKNHIFSNCGGRRENCWGISCEKSRFYAKKIIFFQLMRMVVGFTTTYAISAYHHQITRFRILIFFCN
jgi:hypothetical protein